MKDQEGNLVSQGKVIENHGLLRAEGRDDFMFEPYSKTHFYRGREIADIDKADTTGSLLSRVKENSFIASIRRNTYSSAMIERME